MMPARLQLIAKQEVLPYLVDEYGGNVQPIIAAAFWSQGGRLTSLEEWQDVVSNRESVLLDTLDVGLLTKTGDASFEEVQKLYKNINIFFSEDRGSSTG